MTIEMPPLNLVVGKEYTAGQLATMEAQRDADLEWFVRLLMERTNYDFLRGHILWTKWDEGEWEAFLKLAEKQGNGG